jgi:DNA-binding transcriptional regulator YiaG
MKNIVNLKGLKKAKYYKSSYIDVSKVREKGFVRNFRIKNNLTQMKLALLLGVSQKTIEKWEQGVNKISGSSATLLALFNERPIVMSYIYKVEGPFNDEINNKCSKPTTLVKKENSELKSEAK